MPTITPYYQLALYNSSTDGAQTFSAYRAAQSGVALTSNMNRIDLALAALQSQITSTSKGTVYVAALEDSANTYSIINLSQITAYLLGLTIILSVNAPNTGTSTLNINLLGVTTLKKVSATGSVTNLVSGDLLVNKFYHFIYDGTYWVLIQGTPPLDTLAAPTDITTLNANTTTHGLLLRATAPGAGLINYVGIGNGETVYANKALFDTTNPANNGSASPGTQVIAARRDHVHASQIVHDQTVFYSAGVVTAGPSPFRVYIPYVGAGATIEEVYIAVGTAPTTTAIQINVKKNGTTIFNTTAYVEMATSAFTASRTTDFVSTALAKDDYFTFEVTQGDVAGSDLTVHVRYKWTLTNS